MNITLYFRPDADPGDEDAAQAQRDCWVTLVASHHKMCDAFLELERMKNPYEGIELDHLKNIWKP